MTTNVEEDEDPTDSDDLLYSLTYGCRILYHTGSWESGVVGVMLEETDDSFLVAMPMKIGRKDGMLFLEEIEPSPYMRMLKSDFRGVSFLAGDLEKAYISYLQKESQKVFPELLSMIGEGDSSTNSTSTIVGVPTVSEPSGISKKDVDDKVKQAIQNGCFINNNGELPN